jgi:CBS domain-containing protein
MVSTRFASSGDGQVRLSTLIQSKGSFVATIGADATVSEVVAALARHSVGALVVSADGQRVEGIVSERDVVRQLHKVGGALLAQPVSSIMTAAVHTCSPDEEVDSLMATMTEHRIRHLPVVRDGMLVGIVSIGDVVKCRMEELDNDRTALVNYISGR